MSKGRGLNKCKGKQNAVKQNNKKQAKLTDRIMKRKEYETTVPESTIER